jgi:predicted cupin superfamily sugar epimerase
MIIHADEGEGTGDGKYGRRATVESFVVGPNIAAGERMQWIVEGGKYKSCFLLPDDDNDRDLGTDGLLISEV